MDAHTATTSKNLKLCWNWEFGNQAGPPLPSILCPNCKNFLNWGLAGPLPPLIGTMSLNLQVFFFDGIPKFLENLLHLAVIFHPLKLLLRIVRITTCGYFSVITKKTHLHATGWSFDNMYVSAGGMAGICSWVTTYPQDVIKSRVQGDGWGKHQRYHGPRHCLRVKIPTNKSVFVNSYIPWSVQETIKEGGWKILYRGFGSTTYRAFIVNGVILLVYNNIMRYYA